MSNVNFKNSFVAMFIVSSLFAYNALAPLVTAFFSSGAATSIAIIRLFVFASAVVAILFIPKRKIPTLFLWLTPYIIFRVAFLIRMTENIYIQNVFFYLDAATAYFIFFAYGFIPSIVAAQFAGNFGEREFMRWMNVFSVLFAIGLLLNFNVLFDADAVRVGLYRLNAISLTSTALAFIIYLIMFVKVSKSNLYLAILILPVLIGAVVASKSRGPLVGVFVAFVVYFLIANAKNRRQLILGSFVLIGLSVFGSYFFNVDIFSLLTNRFFFSSEYNSDADLSGTARVFLYRAAWEQFLADPLLGRYIFIELVSNYYPHNLFLESLISLGVIGGFMYLCFAAVTTYAAFGILRNANAPRVALFIIFIFLKEFVESMFSGNLIGSAEIWVTSAMIISFNILLNRQRRGGV